MRGWRTLLLLPVALLACCGSAPPDPVVAFAERVTYRAFDHGWCHASDLGDVALTALHCVAGPGVTWLVPAGDVHAYPDPGNPEVACRREVPERAWVVVVTREGVRFHEVRLHGSGGLLVTEDVRAAPGWSGAPVVDDQGRVVGVVVGWRRTDGATVVSDPAVTCAAIARVRRARAA